jgi:hypothetical protein
MSRALAWRAAQREAISAQVLFGGSSLTCALANCSKERWQLQRAASRKRTPKK